ncbi:PREDICTED: uncharacterized protein LOC104758094 isoform X2 [Camelina sativa]|uniref:Uncharacterized protein LOC104758094 isoform X2 n=1 Tax=Camelina sativa TaxID=90675 RepID=A0ABM0X1G3_CAMSA|nr:PREDICTED: uncharacterized protein LOC104758094 isoform X2 [Camelina sativa]
MFFKLYMYYSFDDRLYGSSYSCSCSNDSYPLSVVFVWNAGLSITKTLSELVNGRDLSSMFPHKKSRKASEDDHINERCLVEVARTIEISYLKSASSSMLKDESTNDRMAKNRKTVNGANNIPEVMIRDAESAIQRLSAIVREAIDRKKSESLLFHLNYTKAYGRRYDWCHCKNSGVKKGGRRNLENSRMNVMRSYNRIFIDIVLDE